MEWFLSSRNKIPVFRKAVRVTLKRAVISLMFNLRPLVLEKKKKERKTLLAVYRVGFSVIKNDIGH